MPGMTQGKWKRFLYVRPSRNFSRAATIPVLRICGAVRCHVVFVEAHSEKRSRCDRHRRVRRVDMRACIKCGKPSVNGTSRCKDHPYKGNWVRSPGSKKEYGWAWQQLSNRVKAEEPNCRYCGRRTVETDHIIPRAEGGTNHRSNLQGLCRECHWQKTKVEARRGLIRDKHRKVASREAQR